MATVYRANVRPTKSPSSPPADLAPVLGAERFLRRSRHCGLQIPHPAALDSARPPAASSITMRRPGRDSARPARPRHPARRRRSGADRLRGGRCPRLRPPARGDPPRHQAGEHPAAGRPADGRRLRHRPGRERGRRRADDRDRPVAGYAALPEPSRRRREGDHRPLRCLLVAAVLYESWPAITPHTGASAQKIVHEDRDGGARARHPERKSVPPMSPRPSPRRSRNLPADRFAGRRDSRGRWPTRSGPASRRGSRDRLPPRRRPGCVTPRSAGSAPRFSPWEWPPCPCPARRPARPHPCSASVSTCRRLPASAGAVQLPACRPTAAASSFRP